MDHHTLVTSVACERDRDEMIRDGEAFFLANGYTAEPGQQEPCLLRCVRGQEGAGWRASDMTQLWCVVSVVEEEEAGTLTMRHEVEVRGQRLSKEDKGFWQREAGGAKAQMESGAEGRDLRPAEQKRAKQVRAHFVKQALRWGLTSFLIVALFMVMLVRMECVHVP